MHLSLRKYLVLYSIVLLFSISCNIFNANDHETILMTLPKADQELIPLAVGNYWIYDQWQIEPTWRDTVRNEVLTIRDVVIENTKIRAYGMYRFRYDEQPREDALISLETNSPEGYFSLGFDAPLDSLNKLSNGLRYKYPASVGDAWEHTALVFNVVDQKLRIGNTRTIELVDTTKTVETPAATFENCYVYVLNDFRTLSTLVHYLYIKPMVGLVGVDTFAGDDLYGQQRLLEYHLVSNSP